MFPKGYLEPSRTSTMKLFSENTFSIKLTSFAKMLPCRCLTGF